MLDSGADRLLRNLRHRAILRVLPPVGTLVDVGCGDDCEFLALAIRRGSAIRGVGVDKLEPHVPVGMPIQGIGAHVEGELPLESAMADALVMAATIEHLDRPSAVLRECLRVLRPAAPIIVTTPALSGKWVLDGAARLGMISAEQIADHKRYYTRPSLAYELAEAGFSEVCVRPFEAGFNLLARAIRAPSQML